MTFQPPPPPPPPGPPGGQPPSQWGPPPGQPYQQPAGGFDPKSVNNLDWGILAAGLLAFIFSFVDYYSYSAKNCGSFCGDVGSVSTTAWSGFFGWFAMLCALVGSAAVGLAVFAPQVKLPIAPRLLALGAYALGALCVLLAIFVVPGYLGYSGPNIDKGHGFGYWVSLIVIIAGLVLCVMRFQQTGGELPGALASRMPGQHHGGGQPPQAPGYAPPPPPAPGYGPPPQGPPPPMPPQGPPQG